MKRFRESLDELVLPVRDRFLARPPASGRRFAPLGFAPILVPAEEPAWHQGEIDAGHP